MPSDRPPVAMQGMHQLEPGVLAIIIRWLENHRDQLAISLETQTQQDIEAAQQILNLLIKELIFRQTIHDSNAGDRQFEIQFRLKEDCDLKLVSASLNLLLTQIESTPESASSISILKIKLALLIQNSHDSL